MCSNTISYHPYSTQSYFNPILPQTKHTQKTPGQFKDLPFAPFAKSDRCGRMADFTSSWNNRPERRGRNVDESQANDNFQYRADPAGDSKEFQLVDTFKQQSTYKKSSTQRKFNNNRNGIRRDQARPAHREEAKEQVRSHIQPQRSKKRNNWGGGGNKRWNNRIDRQASVKIQASWRVIEEVSGIEIGSELGLGLGLGLGVGVGVGVGVEHLIQHSMNPT